MGGDNRPTSAAVERRKACASRWTRAALASAAVGLCVFRRSASFLLQEASREEFCSFVARVERSETRERRASRTFLPGFRFHLRALRFGGLKPSEARPASAGGPLNPGYEIPRPIVMHSAIHCRIHLTKVGNAVRLLEMACSILGARKKAQRENGIACVIASASEAIQGRLAKAKRPLWIASSLSLLAMTSAPRER